MRYNVTVPPTPSVQNPPYFPSAKIIAIKIYRALTNKGLKDSKDYIESLPFSETITFSIDSKILPEDENRLISQYPHVTIEKIHTNNFTINITGSDDIINIEFKSNNLNFSAKTPANEFQSIMTKIIPFVQEIGL